MLFRSYGVITGDDINRAVEAIQLKSFSEGADATAEQAGEIHSIEVERLKREVEARDRMIEDGKEKASAMIFSIGNDIDDPQKLYEAWTDEMEELGSWVDKSVSYYYPKQSGEGE